MQNHLDDLGAMCSAQHDSQGSRTEAALSSCFLQAEASGDDYKG